MTRIIQHKENPKAKQILSCVLADLMGMGKTLELILLIYFLYYIAKNQKEVDELLARDDEAEIKEKLKRGSLWLPVINLWESLPARRIATQLAPGPAIILVPGDMVRQWNTEWGKYAMEGFPLDLIIQNKAFPDGVIRWTRWQARTRGRGLIYMIGRILPRHPSPPGTSLILNTLSD